MKKSKQLKHLTTASILALSFTLGACGKTYTTNQIITPGTSAAQLAGNEANGALDLAAWKRLVTSDEKNIALAEILAGSVAEGNKALVKELVESLTDKEINKILAQVSTERDSLRGNFLLRNNLQIQGTELFRQSLIANDYNYVNTSKTELAMLSSATFGYMKSKALDEIYKSYDKAILENSKDIGISVIVDIGKNDPETAKKIEEAAKAAKDAADFGKRLAKIREYTAKADKFFAGSGLEKDEQFLLLTAGAVGGVIYTLLKETPAFKDLMKTYAEVKEFSEDVKKKIKAVREFMKVVKDNNEQMKVQAKIMQDGMKEAGSEIKKSAEAIKTSMYDDKPINPKEMAKVLYDQVIAGKAPTKTSPSILEAHGRIGASVQKSFSAAASMAGSLDNIIAATNVLATTFGIKLPTGVQKALAFASKVTAGVKLASAVISGFATGGVMAAVGMLSSGPLAGLMGGGGADPQVMAALGRIEAKLDVVLENQRKMLELQMETLKMIKELAIMVDEYHQKEMNALAALHDDAVLNKKISAAVLNSDLRSCEAIIDQKLKQFAKYGARSFSSATYSVDFANFYSQFKKMEDFRIFAEGGAKIDFDLCQSTFSKAFASPRLEGNPMLSIYSDDGETNLYSFERNTFAPLVDLLNEKSEHRGQDKKILHLPMASISALDMKSEQLMVKNDYADDSAYEYQLENLISTKALERYLNSYLLLFPVVEFNKEAWSLSLPELVDTYYKNLGIVDGYIVKDDNGYKVSRSFNFMDNALDLIQSAIAQEAILAGESLIPTMHKDSAAAMVKELGCPTAAVCAARSNPLFMQNYLNYVIHKNFNASLSLEKYKQALETKNSAVLGLFVGATAAAPVTIKANANGRMVIVLRESAVKGIEVQLPSADSIEDNKMLYSENMESLLRMQKEVISALIKIAPSDFRTTDERNGMANLLLLK